MTRSMKKTQTLSISLLIVLFTFAVAFAQGSRERSTKKTQAASQQSSNAARVFTELRGPREKSMPRDLLDKAEAVAVFPGVLKGGFIVGGRGGSRVITRPVGGGRRVSAR